MEMRVSVLCHVQAMVQAYQAGSAGADDSDGPRMSMAMRRQLGIAPAKSPSKASSPHGAARGRVADLC